MTSILFNKYFFLLLFFMMIYVAIIIINKFPYVKNDQSDREFLLALGYYRINNIYYTVFVSVLYSLMYFGTFLLLRILGLGTKMDIYDLNVAISHSNSVLNAILGFSCIILYIKIINSLFYFRMIQLYYYTYKYLWFRNMMNNISMELTILSRKYFELCAVLNKYLILREELISIYTKKLKLHERLDFKFQSKPEIEYLLNRDLKIWHIVNDNKFTYLVVTMISHILTYIKDPSRLLQPIPYAILILILLWEIHHGTLYNIYYVLFIYFLILWFRKIRYFFSVKDPIDVLISNYFYDSESSYDKIKLMLEKGNIISALQDFGENGVTMLRYRTEIITYFLNDFKAYYVMYPVRKKNERFLINDSKRIIHLSLILCGIIYYWYNIEKYSLTFLNTYIRLDILFFILFLTLCAIQKRILFESSETSEQSDIVWGENKPYKYLYGILFSITCSVMLYIMLKNKISLMPNEMIFEIKDYITIIEAYNFKEKTEYLWNYITLLKKTLHLNTIDWHDIENRIKSAIIVDNDLTLEMIREKVRKVISLHDSESNNSTTGYIIEKVSRFFESMKDIVKTITNIFYK